MTLDVRAVIGLGGPAGFSLDVELAARPGETVALLGPNGAGKSTLLRVLAGLLAIDEGRLTLDDTVLDDPDTDVFVNPDARPVGVVFQDYLLFPTMSVLENVAFGLRARRIGRHEARERARGWLERVGLADRARDRPTALSGGQQQRVALARALATEPRLLLLDEPLAALDAGTRAEVRRELRRHLDSFDGLRILVTHDPVDAYALADRIVVLEGGRVAQSGTLAEVTAHPRSSYVADLVGINLLSGTVDAHTFRTGGHDLVIAGDAPDGRAFAAIHPRAITIHPDEPHGSPRNVWAAVVTDLDQRGDVVRVRMDGPLALTAEVTAGAVAALDLHLGSAAWVAVKATEIVVYPA